MVVHLSHRIFHLLNATTFGIGIFPWLMIAASTIWFDPSWPRRFLGGRTTPSDGRTSNGGTASTSRLGPAFAAVWLTVQLLVPLRHFLYPGNVHWTEEGHAFSWHMKLRGKDGHALFTIRDPRTGEVKLVDPRAELAPWQARKMSTRPDMVLQYAHHLADSWPGETRPEVYARVEASLNARPRQLLIDPEVNLAEVEPSLWPDPWIVPLEPLPTTCDDGGD